MRRRARATRQDAGYVAAELALGVGLLVFPVAMLVLTLPTWSERQASARAIAREMARTVCGTATSTSRSSALRGRGCHAAAG
jgi:hypothetical protein